MTSADTKRWKEVFGKVCAMHGREWDDAQSRFYWDALKDCELAAVQTTCESLMQNSKWFPKPAEWHSEIDRLRFQARLERDRELAGRLNAPVECTDCGDSGWRVTQREPVERVGACQCRQTNLNYQARQARGRLSADTTNGVDRPTAPPEDVAIDFKRLGSGE